MASTYTFDQLYGSGSLSQALSSGVTYTFTITNNSGSSYFVMETTRNTLGYYDSLSPKNTSGSFVITTNSASYNQSDYIAGFALPTGTNEFEFTPAVAVSNSTLKLRGTGGITLDITP